MIIKELWDKYSGWYCAGVNENSMDYEAFEKAIKEYEAKSAVQSVVMAQLSILCKDALCTDGAHHKQWYLSQILKVIEPKTYNHLKEKSEDLGLAP